MSWITIIFFTVLLFYAFTLLTLALGFLRSPKFSVPSSATPVPVTIIICARNEEKTIGGCLRSILMQEYAQEKMQLILVNDASSDSTLQQSEALLKGSGIRYNILSNTQQKGKKVSISLAMQLADNELILLRDADTFTNSIYWLQTVSAFYQASFSDLVIGPVAISDNFGILWALQAIETNVLALVAGGSSFYRQPFLCNGANLAFKKSLFEKTKGYSSHINQASGDDIFFLEDAKKIAGAKIAYLKSTHAIVSTYPCYSFKQLLAQKTRWASKFKTNKNKLSLFLAFLSMAVNAIWLVCFVSCYFTLAEQGSYMLFIFCKLSIDLLLLFLASSFIINKSLWWFALPVACIYPIYTCLVSLASMIAKPKWKP